MIIPKETFNQIFNPDDVVYIGSSPLLNAWLKSKDRDGQTHKHSRGLISLSGETTSLLHSISLKEGVPESRVLESMIKTYASARGYTEK